MSENTGYYQLIEHIHERVRTFVEQAFPGYKVTKIRMEADTEYQPPPHSLTDDPYKLQWPLVKASIRFKVDASELVNSISCDVYAASDGTLCIGSQTITVPASPLLRRRKG